MRIAGTKSSPIDLVTEMDQACEQLIRERLAASRPGDGFLGEESGEAVSDAASDCRWIVDPIDGTVNYVYGLPQWAVSIAAERQGVVVAGAVVAPALEEEYLGVLGQGSWRLAGGDRERLVCSQQTELAQALVATGFGYRRERRVEQGGSSQPCCLRSGISVAAGPQLSISATWQQVASTQDSSADSTHGIAPPEV